MKFILFQKITSSLLEMFETSYIKLRKVSIYILDLMQKHCLSKKLDLGKMINLLLQF